MSMTVSVGGLRSFVVELQGQDGVYARYSMEYANTLPSHVHSACKISPGSWILEEKKGNMAIIVVYMYVCTT